LFEASPFRMMERGTALHVPAGDAGRLVLHSADVPVPSGSEGRENWHREQHCAVTLVRFLLTDRPDLFPATLLRSDAPDFVLSPDVAAHRAIGIEHTDMGSQTFQRTLDAASASGEPSLVILIGPDGCVGDAPAQAWTDDLRDAVVRKSDPKCWRGSPAGTARWLLIYDNARTAIAVENQEARRRVSALLHTESAAAGIDAIALVRDPGTVVLVQRSGDFA